MKYLVALAILAVAATAQECSEERADGCVDSLLKSLLGDDEEGDVCRELQSSIDCLRTAVDDCTGGEKNEEVEKGLEELGKVFDENCEEDDKKKEETDEEDSEMAKCFAENAEYVYECLVEAMENSQKLLQENDREADEDNVVCIFYDLATNCFVERTEEKCGEVAAELAKEDFKDMPPEVAHACSASASEGIIAHTFELLGEDRK